MNKYEKLVGKLEALDKIQIATSAFIDEPLLIEHMDRDDLDIIIFDMEHGRFNTESLRNNLYACRLLNIPSVVRVQDTGYHLISKTIDAGADGIMLPRTESLEQLRTAADAIRFFPAGKKGYGGPMQFRKGETFEGFQSGRFLFPQIESPKGIKNLPVMLREYGWLISGIVVGPYDLSVMLGTPGDLHTAAMLSAFEQIIGVCREYKKSSGIYCRNSEDAALYKKMGANIFWLSTDLNIYMDGYTMAFDALSKI